MLIRKFAIADWLALPGKGRYGLESTAVANTVTGKLELRHFEWESTGP